jgi:hypothetical protein
LAPHFDSLGLAELPQSEVRGADADEDVGVPAENFSPCLGVSVRGLRGRRCGGSAAEIMPHFSRLSAQKWIAFRAVLNKNVMRSIN